MSSELEKLDERATYTRGKVLKRAGIGVAAAWSVPLFISTATADAAVNRKVCVASSFQHGLDAPCDTCFNGNIANMCSGTCFCFVGSNGCCECRSIGGGCGNPTCNVNADCPRGFKCVLTCCDGGGANPGRRCLPACSGSGELSAADLKVVNA